MRSRACSGHAKNPADHGVFSGSYDHASSSSCYDQRALPGEHGVPARFLPTTEAQDRGVITPPARSAGSPLPHRCTRDKAGHLGTPEVLRFSSLRGYYWGVAMNEQDGSAAAVGDQLGRILATPSPAPSWWMVLAMTGVGVALTHTAVRVPQLTVEWYWTDPGQRPEDNDALGLYDETGITPYVWLLLWALWLGFCWWQALRWLLSFFHLRSACVDEGLDCVDEQCRVVRASADAAEDLPAFELGVRAFAGSA